MGRDTRIEHLTESEKLFEMRLVSGEPLGHNPGQFVELSVMGIGEAPISISSAPTENDLFELAIRKIGNFTTAIQAPSQGTGWGSVVPLAPTFP